MPDADLSRVRLLRVVVLASGTATMALQMCAVRLLAPWVGASIVVWSTIIGLSLLAMSVGYAAGGRLADRSMDGRALARTLTLAAVLVAAVPAVAPALLPHVTLGAQGARADLVGSAIGFGALFLAPAILLGVTPPYAIRLALARVDDAGRTAGRLYALSTVGSILGTLLAALVLVQWVGTRVTLGGIAILLLVGADAARRVRGLAGPDATDAAVVRAPELAAGSDAAVVGIRFATVVVLVEGAALMTTELAIARLVAPFFGTSQAVWAVIIATVMGSIALGSRIGGRLADRLPTVTGLSVVLVLAAVAVALLPVVAPPVMRPASGGIDEVHVGVVIASFLATMALLVVPITLLGAVPPWLLRLAVPGVGRTGRTAGRLYASSTAGALAGTFGSTLWLVPELGTRRTMLLAAAALALLAAVGLHRAAREPGWVRLAPAAALVLVVVLAVLPTGLVKPLGDGRHVLEERESRYQFVQAVEEEDGRRILQLNEGWAVHSLWERGAVLTHNYWDHFAVVPSLTRERARDMLVIGDAGGTTRRLVGRIRPDLRIDAVELDPDVTAVGRRWFDLRGHVVASDGRPFLARTDRHWDAMMIDAYRQPYIPFYLTTREFFETAKRRLRPGGVVSINVGSAPGDRRIDDAIAATMRDVFPTVVRYRAEPYNDVIVAVDDPGVSISQLRRRIDRGVAGLAPVDGVDEGDLDDLFGRFSDRMRAVRPDHDRVLTDDRAPVEWMTDRMIFGAAGD